MTKNEIFIAALIGIASLIGTIYFLFFSNMVGHKTIALILFLFFLSASFICGETLLSEEEKMKKK